MEKNDTARSFVIGCRMRGTRAGGFKGATCPVGTSGTVRRGIPVKYAITVLAGLSRVLCGHRRVIYRMLKDAYVTFFQVGIAVRTKELARFSCERHIFCGDVPAKSYRHKNALRTEIPSAPGVPAR